MGAGGARGSPRWWGWPPGRRMAGAGRPPHRARSRVEVGREEGHARGPCSPPPPLLLRAWGRRRRGLRLAMAPNGSGPTRVVDALHRARPGRNPAQGAGPRHAACWCPGELRRRAAGGVHAAPPPRPPQDPAATRGSAAASPWPRPTAGGARGGPPLGRAELGEARIGGDGRRGGGWPARGGAEAAAPRPLPCRGREGGGARARPCLRPPLLAQRRGGRCDEAGGTDGTRRDPALLPPRRRPWRRLAMALPDGGAREARQ